MATPRVSVVLPTWNRADLLPRAVASVLAQTFHDVELIVVDDASTDGTEAWLAKVDDPRVTTVRRAERGGPAAARNLGIERARGELVAFQDSDDEWAVDRLARTVEAFDAAEPAVVYSDLLLVQPDGSTEVLVVPEPHPGVVIDEQRLQYATWGIGIQSSLVPRRWLLEAGGFDERLPAFEDLDLFLRLAATHPFRRVSEPLVQYHQTDGVSRDRDANLRARALLLRRHLGAALRAPAFLSQEVRFLLRTLVRERRW